MLRKRKEIWLSRTEIGSDFFFEVIYHLDIVRTWSREVKNEGQKSFWSFPICLWPRRSILKSIKVILQFKRKHWHENFILKKCKTENVVASIVTIDIPNWLINNLIFLSPYEKSMDMERSMRVPAKIATRPLRGITCPPITQTFIFLVSVVSDTNVRSCRLHCVTKSTISVSSQPSHAPFRFSYAIGMRCM